MAGFRERRKMLHNVLSRQLPVDPARVDGGPGRRRHRSGPAAADPRGGGVARAARGARSDRAGRPRTTRIRPAGSGMTAVDPLRRLSPVVRLAPAKLNLTLAVIGRRDDGYHSLHSVFVPLALADRLSLAAAAGQRDTLHVSGLDAGPRQTIWCSGPSPRPGPRSAVAGPAVPHPLRPSPPASTSGSPSPRAWPAARRMRLRRSMAPSRRGAPNSTTTRVTGWPPASARTSRSSWPAGRPSSKAGARP